jgi:hypothetical protein
VLRRKSMNRIQWLSVTIVAPLRPRRPDAIETNMNVEREQLKKQYGSLFETVTALLFQSDPMGINFSDNTDEYDPETGTILPRLAGAKSVDDVQTIVYEEFCRWFDPAGAGSRDAYREVCLKIWEAWQTAFPVATAWDRRDDSGSRDE